MLQAPAAAYVVRRARSQETKRTLRTCFENALDRRSLAGSLTLVLVFVLTIAPHGPPVLRHDWQWYSDSNGLLSTCRDFIFGWLPAGIGSPNPYPDSYLLALPIFAFGSAVSSYFAFLLYISCIGALIALAGWGIGARCHASAELILGIQAFLLFNPWVYTEMVAGHHAMVLAYGATAAFVGFASGNRRWPSVCLALLVVLSLPQLQYFLVMTLIALFYAISTRKLLPLATSAIIGLPLALGILLNVDTLLGSVYLATWQKAESVSPAQAFLLSGYFAKYDASIAPGFTLGMAGIALLTVLSLWLARRSRATIVFGGFLLLVVCLAMGFNGPFSSIYDFTIAHVPQSAVFRELYDLLGFAAIAYAALLGFGLASNRIGTVLLMICCASLILGWVISPPFGHWVSDFAIPHAQIKQQSNSRFALLPAFQPMSFEGKGSGSDPDAYSRPGNVTPVNTYYATYPVDMALARYTLDGDVRPLSELGVASIISRQWLRSDESSLQLQRSLPAPATIHRKRIFKASVQHLYAEPELTLSPIPSLTSLSSDIDGRNVFFADVAGLSGIAVPRNWRSLSRVSVVRAPNRCVRASCGWTDVSLAFATNPSIAQGLGGALTTSSSATLGIRPARMVLVNVRGTLTAASALVSTSTKGYRWVPLPRGATQLRCRGTCIVVATGEPPPSLSLNASRQRYAGVIFQAIAPWLIRATLPSGPDAMLRYSVAFNRAWAASVDVRPLPHFRADAIFNAWLLPKRQNSQTVWIFEKTAILQLAFSIVGALWALLIVYKTLRVSIDRFGHFEIKARKS